jgi:hypothetical protein
MPGDGLPSGFLDVGWVAEHLKVIEPGEPTFGHGDNVVDLKISPHVAFPSSSSTGNKTGCICVLYLSGDVILPPTGSTLLPVGFQLDQGSVGQVGFQNTC